MTGPASRDRRYGVYVETLPLPRDLGADLPAFQKRIGRRLGPVIALWSDPVLRSLRMICVARAPTASVGVSLVIDALVDTLSSFGIEIDDSQIRLEFGPPEFTDERELVNASQAARILGLSKERVRQYMIEGRFPEAVGNFGRHIVFRTSHIRDWDVRLGRWNVRQLAAQAVTALPSRRRLPRRRAD